MRRLALRLCAVFSLLLLVGCYDAGESVLVRVGMGRAEFMKTMKDAGGTSIGALLEVLPTAKDSYWELKSYKLVVYADYEKDVVKNLIYWKDTDYAKSKSHRAEHQKYATELQLERSKRISA